MKRRLLAFGLMLSGSIAWCDQNPPADSAVYDPDPHHLWNRLNDTLFVRTAPDGTRYGIGRLDILYWTNTQHLLASPSHEQALQVLDEFIATHGERLIHDPLKRALLQRDLWALFDWSAKPNADVRLAKQRGELQQRLVVLIQRLALSTGEIATLPDNYAQSAASNDSADFPRGLFEPSGEWVNVAAEEDYTALGHLHDFSARSLFLVLVHFPDGRERALSYLKRLHDFEPALQYTNPPGESREELAVNRSVPQFPKGTEWALVRRMCVIDDRGEIQPTRLIESIQLRRYDSVESAERAAQRLAEFQLDRRNGATLRTVTPEEEDFQFVQFMSMGWDPLEGGVPESKYQGKTLQTCYQCHADLGVLSVRSFNRSRFVFPKSPIQRLQSSSLDQENAEAVAWKHQQYDWGLLQRLWRAAGQQDR